MNKKIASIIFSCFAIFIINSCSVFENGNVQSNVVFLNTQIKKEKFGEIYEESSSNLKSRISKEKFISRMESFTQKMKNIDESLVFQKSSLSETMPKLLNTENWKNSYEKIENNNRKIEILISWAKDSDSFKLVGISLIQHIEDGKFRIDYLEGRSEVIQ